MPFGYALPPPKTVLWVARTGLLPVRPGDRGKPDLSYSSRYCRSNSHASRSGFRVFMSIPGARKVKPSGPLAAGLTEVIGLRCSSRVFSAALPRRRSREFACSTSDGPRKRPISRAAATANVPHRKGKTFGHSQHGFGDQQRAAHGSSSRVHQAVSRARSVPPCSEVAQSRSTTSAATSGKAAVRRNPRSDRRPRGPRQAGGWRGRAGAPRARRWIAE